MGLFSKGQAEPNDVGILSEEFANLQAAHAERIDRFAKYRAEGQASRTQDLTSSVGMSDTQRDYGRGGARDQRVFRHDIILPFGKALNVKHSYRIAGQLPDVVVEQRDESPEEKFRSDEMEKLVWSIFRHSRAETQFASAAWDGSEVGASCFDLYYDIGKQMPLFRAVDPGGIIEVQGARDPHDFLRVYRFWDAPLASVVAEYRNEQFRGEPVKINELTQSHAFGNVPMITLASMCDDERQIVFAPNSKTGLFETIHEYGFVPYVIIPNIGPEREIWGWADYEFIRPLTAYISALFSREADILRAVANGTYVENGTGQNVQVIKKTLAEGGVIPSKRDGKLEPVQPPDVPNFEVNHAERAMEMFKMLGFVPDAAWGNGFSGSATDRGLMLQPLVEFTAMKQMNWEAGLGRLFSMAFQMIEKKQVGKAKFTGSRINSFGKRKAFSTSLTAGAAPEEVPNPALEAGFASEDPGAGFDVAEMISLPRDPAQLFDKEYEVRFTWNNRIDPDDPAYALGETNKFTAGVQSLERTMERLGVEAPEDEMQRMEDEAERFPWINQGLIQLIRAQISAGAQGSGGGQPADPLADQAAAAGVASGPQGAALGGDAAIQGLGAAAQSGIPYGSA
jgi:hypothetical protein